MNLAGMLPHTLTYWARGVNDKFNDFVFATPVQQACRWRDKAVQYRNEQGELQLSKAVVHSLTPLPVGGYILLGTSAATDPRALAGAFEIKGTDRANSIDATETLYKALI
jgi:hypothetical protein